VRILLDRCATTDEALALLRRLPHGLGFNYSLLDASGHAAVAECAPGRVEAREGAPLACANHFETAAMRPRNRRAIGHSTRRMAPLAAIAAEAADLAALYGRLNDAGSPVFLPATGRGVCTLHTLAAEPATRALLVGIGGDATPARIDLAAWTAGAPLGFAALEGRLGLRGDGRAFRNADLSGAEFRNVSLAGARFDDIDFSGAEIGANCNFTGMRIAGAPVAELLAAWRAKKSD